MTDLHTTTKEEWNNLILSGAPWGDFETEKFMMNLPSIWFNKYD